jgi:phosphoribosylpyrophosphate synthetase
MTMDLHADQIQGFLKTSDHLFASTISTYLKKV